VNCFICNSSKLTGLTDLPHGSHLVVAPFLTGQQTAAPGAALGSALRTEPVDTDGGPTSSGIRSPTRRSTRP